MNKPVNEPGSADQAPPPGSDEPAGDTEPAAASSDGEASATDERDPGVTQIMEDVMRDMSGAEGADGAASDAPMTLESALLALEKVRADVSAARETALRARADSDNVRKRAERDVEKAHRFALEGFAKELLPVIDALEMGLQSTPTEASFESLRQGTEMVLEMLLAACKKYGLERVDPEGQPFDPEFHQAMATGEGDGASNVVLQVHQRGYVLNGRLVRPALVVVSK